MPLIQIARHMRLPLVLALVGLAECTAPEPPGYEPMAGDVLFQSLPHDPLTDMIEGASQSPFSHCGLVMQIESEWVVLEAFAAVGDTPLAEWIDRGRGDAFAAFRWRDEFADQVPKIINAAERYIGRPYDIHYAMDDQAIYCSELIFKAFRDVTGKEAGALIKLKELNWQPYEDLIRNIERGPVPLEREMITPVALSKAAQLNQVRAFDGPEGS